MATNKQQRLDALSEKIFDYLNMSKKISPAMRNMWNIWTDPGQEAQVDWHEAVVYENNVQKKVYVFCMKLCFSKAPFVCTYQSMTIECFLDGHVRAFEYLGGVPRRIAYDNLKTAVKDSLHAAL